MAIRLITGRLQQRSRYSTKEQQILQRTPCGIHYNWWLPLRVAESTNGHITLRTQENRLTGQR